MKIVDLLVPECIVFELKVEKKEDVWRVLAEKMHEIGVVADVEQYLDDVNKRESHGTTGVGFGVAIPHAKSAAVTKPGLAMARLSNAIDVASLDGTNADLFFLIASPESGNIHLRALSKLARMLMHESFLSALRSAESPQEILEVIAERDE